MKKISIKLALVLLIVVVSLFSMSIVINATGDAEQTITGLFENGNADTTGITNVGANIVSIVTTVGIIVAVIVLLVLGIKYMMGSAAEKAEYKKTMIPYLIGAVLIFGASAIAKAVIAMTQSITN